MPVLSEEDGKESSRTSVLLEQIEVLDSFVEMVIVFAVGMASLLDLVLSMETVDFETMEVLDSLTVAIVVAKVAHVVDMAAVDLLMCSRSSFTRGEHCYLSEEDGMTFDVQTVEIKP
jgi:hypothetical protein